MRKIRMSGMMYLATDLKRVSADGYASSHQGRATERFAKNLDRQEQHKEGRGRIEESKRG